MRDDVKYGEDKIKGRSAENISFSLLNFAFLYRLFWSKHAQTHRRANVLI